MMHLLSRMARSWVLVGSRLSASCFVRCNPKKRNRKTRAQIAVLGLGVGNNNNGRRRRGRGGGGGGDGPPPRDVQPQREVDGVQRLQPVPKTKRSHRGPLEGGPGQERKGARAGDEGSEWWRCAVFRVLGAGAGFRGGGGSPSTLTLCPSRLRHAPLFLSCCLLLRHERVSVFPGSFMHAVYPKTCIPTRIRLGDEQHAKRPRPLHHQAPTTHPKEGVSCGAPEWSSARSLLVVSCCPLPPAASNSPAPMAP